MQGCCLAAGDNKSVKFYPGKLRTYRKPAETSRAETGFGLHPAVASRHSMVLKPGWDSISAIISHTFPLGSAWKSAFRATQLHSAQVFGSSFFTLWLPLPSTTPLLQKPLVPWLTVTGPSMLLIKPCLLALGHNSLQKG